MRAWLFFKIYCAESQDNYDEDFNSSVSVSAKEDLPNQGTDTEIEEELGSGVEDLLSSNSAVSSRSHNRILISLDSAWILSWK